MSLKQYIPMLTAVLVGLMATLAASGTDRDQDIYNGFQAQKEIFVSKGNS